MKDEENQNLDNFEEDIIVDSEVVDFDENTDEISAPNKIKKLQDRIKELEKERTEYLDGWQRALADYANLQKTTTEDKKRIKKLVEEDWMHKLIPVVDSFQMAFSNKEAWDKVEPAWRSGVEYIYQQLMSTLESHGLKLFGEVGEIFDPTKHEAISEEETQNIELDHTISKIIQKGFILDENIIRPAKVYVNVLK